jgi:hypothetical protein
MKNTASHIIQSFLIVIILGLICNCLWLYEILQIKSWTGLLWLNGYMISVFLIIPLTVSSYVLTLRLVVKTSFKNLIISLLGLSIISLISFHIAREIFYAINSRFFGFTSSHFFSIITVLTVIIVPNLIYCFGYYFMTNRFLIKIRKMTIFLFIGSIVLSIIFGLITVNINSGFGSGSTFIDSVKMGYPIFWLNIFLGIIAIIIPKMKKN